MSDRRESAAEPLNGDSKFELRKFKPLSVERVQQLLGGRYSVIRELGAGGTSIVFLAHDAARGEPVAVKVLRPELSVAVVAARFLREIEIGKRLAHSNVLQIYEYGSADGELYCIMPFVNGETLRQRMARETQLSIPDALRIGRAVADALDYAHQLDVIHRDIKPANILLDDDRVIVADFGIARAMNAAASGDLTETGLALGTATYMSPEQGSADRVLSGRTDVYSLACVVYEMLAGEPPFTGPTPQAIIARHRQEPPRSLRIVRPSVPLEMQRAVEKALSKVPADRFATAGELFDALEAGARGDARDVATDASQEREALIPAPTRAVTRPRAAVGAATVGVVILIAVFATVGWWRATHASPPPPHRFTIEMPTDRLIDGATQLPIALSRDGQSLAFIAGQRLFIRPFGQLQPIAFPKAQPAAELHFSSDGKWLAYTNGGPNKISVDPRDIGVEPTRLTERLMKFAESAWTYSADVVYLVDDTFWRVPSGGSAPVKFASVDTAVDGHWMRPTMMPDGKTIAFRVTPRGAAPGSEADRLAFISIDGGQRTLLDLKSQGAVGYSDGTLVFARIGGRLWGVRFDLDHRKMLGEPVDLATWVSLGASGATLSENGTLAYVVDSTKMSTLQIVDERGLVAWRLPDVRAYFQPVLSPDGKRIAMYVAEKEQNDIWVCDIASRELRKLTQMGGAFGPAWTPDGKRIAFIRNGEAMWVPADASSSAEPIPGTSALGGRLTQIAISPNGEYAIARQAPMPRDAADRPYAFAVPLAGGPPVPLLEGAKLPVNLALSPNGKWIAYSSRETGNHEVYVRPFLGGAANVQVSTDGGGLPRWSRDGQTLFYRHSDEFRTATLDFGGGVPHVVRSATLELDRDAAAGRRIVSYSVHPKAKQFVVTRNASDVKLEVVINWMTEVRQKLAGK